MADSFIELNNGKLANKEATDVSTGVAEAGDIVALGPDGRLDSSLLPVGVGQNVKVLPATEALSAGDYVNVFDAGGGVFSVRLADNSNGREACGFVSASVAIGANATVFTSGENSDLTGLADGRVYLGTLGGIIQTPLDPSSNAGNLHQFLGNAVSSTSVETNLDDCIQL